MLTIFLVYPARPLKTLHAYIHIIALPVSLGTGHLPFPLFISAMASQQDNQDLLSQETRLGETLLNLSKGQEELRTLLTGTLVRNNAEDDKDERLKRLQAEVDTLKTQMLGQRSLIQGLAHRTLLDLTQGLPVLTKVPHQRSYCFNRVSIPQAQLPHSLSSTYLKGVPRSGCSIK